MDYFKINYNKLQNMPEFKLFKVVVISILLGIILIILASRIEVYKTFSVMGIYSDKRIVINLDYELISNLNKSEYLIFNDKRSNFEITNIGEYEFINSNIYQNIELELDTEFIDNEVGIVEFYYDKQNLLKYIFELFK